MTTQQLILSHCIQDSDKFRKIQSHADFFEGEELKIFNMLFSMLENKKAITPVTVLDFYKSIENNPIDIELFTEIHEQALYGHMNDNDFYVSFKELANKNFRKLKSELDWETLEPEEIQQKIHEKMFSLDYRVGNKIEKIQVALRECLEEEDVCIWSGYHYIDEVLGGWQSEFIIIGARPSSGKTTLSLNFMLPMAKNGVKIGVFSAEMNRRSIVRNMLTNETGIPALRIKKKMYSKQEEQKLTAKANMIYEKFNIWIDDTPNIEIEELKYKAKKMVKEFGVQILFIDYIQILKTFLFRKEKKLDQVTYISGELKQLQRELDVPLIACAQLTRDADGQRPMISQLKEAGALEQDADKVALIYNTANENNPDVLNTELIWGKNRNGPTGVQELKYYKECCRFTDRSNE